LDEIGFKVSEEQMIVLQESSLNEKPPETKEEIPVMTE